MVLTHDGTGPLSPAHGAVRATGYGCFAQYDGRHVRLVGTTAWARLVLLGSRARQGEVVVPLDRVDTVQLEVGRTVLRRRLVVRSRLGMWRLHFPATAVPEFDVLMDGIEAAHRAPADGSGILEGPRPPQEDGGPTAG
jgi:hypothetical protein